MVPSLVRSLVGQRVFTAFRKATRAPARRQATLGHLRVSLGVLGCFCVVAPEPVGVFVALFASRLRNRFVSRINWFSHAATISA
ncbi:hypothetical protein KIPE111705_07185 [Kibdelosporangium persicum]